MKKILILLLAICSFSQLKATHLMGGEITWECIKSGPDIGKYIFKLKLYRDCDGITLFNTRIFKHNDDGLLLTEFAKNNYKPLETKSRHQISHWKRLLDKKI